MGKFYEKEESANEVCGYNDIYVNLMDHLTQNCCFALLDDYRHYKEAGNKGGKLYVIDPYDTETLQIFFDTDTDENPDKIDIVDVVTKKKINRESVLNTFLVNVEPYRAILDINYFTNKIEECINNRKAELNRMMGKELPNIPLTSDFDYQKESAKINSDAYLQMTVFPLLHNALSLCDTIRPQDPITFIANYMLMNKSSAKSIEEIIKMLPPKSQYEDLGEGEAEEEEAEAVAEEEEAVPEEHKEENKVEEKKS